MKYRLAAIAILLAAAGCKGPFRNNLPSSAELMHPGPGVDGPGPGVMMPGPPPGPPPGAAQSVSQLAFVGPEGMNVSWDAYTPGAFDSEPLVCPGRYNFPQGALYRLKLTNVPGVDRQGVELYPSVEIAFATPRTEAFLAHNPIPIQFTEEDLDQVLTGNFVTKVIYLPDSEYQDLAVAGVETLVSTRMSLGEDPIVEADRRGTIMAIIRLGNIDLNAPGGALMGDGGMMPGMDGCNPMAGGGAVPPAFVSGVTAPQYGMTMSGTPIGLPGPPHIPLGVPAGLQSHTMRNHTHYHLPKPTEHIGIHVKHRPGFSYPKPPHKVFVRERSFSQPALYRQSFDQAHRRVSGASTGGATVQCAD